MIFKNNKGNKLICGNVKSVRRPHCSLFKINLFRDSALLFLISKTMIKE